MSLVIRIPAAADSLFSESIGLSAVNDILEISVGFFGDVIPELREDGNRADEPGLPERILPERGLITKDSGVAINSHPQKVEITGKKFTFIYEQRPKSQQRKAEQS
jgi:hypothetical protein